MNLALTWEWLVNNVEWFLVIAGLVAGGTDGGNRTLDAAGTLDFVSDASVARSLTNSSGR